MTESGESVSPTCGGNVTPTLLLSWDGRIMATAPLRRLEPGDRIDFELEPSILERLPDGPLDSLVDHIKNERRIFMPASRLTIHVSLNRRSAVKGAVLD